MIAEERAPGTVLHFAADWLPPSEVFVYELIRHLRRPGVVVAANKLQNIGRFGMDDLHTLAPIERFVRPIAARPCAFTAALGLLSRRRGVGLVHVHHGYRCEVVVPLVKRRRLPLVLSLHGHDVTGYLDERPAIYGGIARFVSAVVVPSKFLVDHAVSAGFDRSLVKVLPSGVDTSFFCASPLPSSEPVAVFVGRFVEKKGIDVLAQAWPRVQSVIPRARLRIMGFGPLEHIARSIPGRVTVEISPDRTAVRDAMRGARLIVSPSHTAPDDALESLLVVNLEAQASGRPVVTTRHGAIPEYVKEGETALLVPEGDAESLAEAMVRVLSDRDLASRLGSKGPEWVARFDVRRTTAAVDALYDELVSARYGQSGSFGSGRRDPATDRFSRCRMRDCTTSRPLNPGL